MDKSGGQEACWLCIGGSSAPWGYKRILVGGQMVRAHRLAWELTNGPIPPGLYVLHRCDNPLCVNPAHLFLGTHADNMADMVAKNRQAMGERHGSVKLTAAQVLEIRQIHTEEGLGYRRLAKRFRVHQQTIADILTGRTWKIG